MLNEIKLSSIIGPAFFDIHKAVKNQTHTTFWLSGGRGSLKSSFVSIEIVQGIMRDPEANAMALMKYGNNIETGIFNQIQWAIDILGVSSYWRASKSPFSFTYYTGQKIYCRGCDDPMKTKSIKLLKGYYKYQWFEEFDMFDGMSEIRKVQQSLTRGGADYVARFYTYNPPITIHHWANAERINTCNDIKSYEHHSTYLQAPRKWLGEQFFRDAEQLKAQNERAYKHEYLGEIVGTGGQVFTNIESKKIGDDIINTFGYISRGLDWGFAVDPLAYLTMYYDRNHNDLYIFNEYYKTESSFDNIAKYILQENSVNTPVRADSAEPRSNAELYGRGINIIPAKKGPGSVEHGIRWLQSLNKIYIDPNLCPNAYREFVGYAYEQDKIGNFKSSYPDKNNHCIDAVRYGLEQEIMQSLATGKILIKH